MIASELKAEIIDLNVRISELEKESVELRKMLDKAMHLLKTGITKDESAKSLKLKD